MKVTITPQSATLTPESDIEIDFLKKWLHGHARITLNKCEQRGIDSAECYASVIPPPPVLSTIRNSFNPMNYEASLYMDFTHRKPEQTKADNL